MNPAIQLTLDFTQQQAPVMPPAPTTQLPEPRPGKFMDFPCTGAVRRPGRGFGYGFRLGARR